jgi:hypothetical protein
MDSIKKNKIYWGYITLRYSYKRNEDEATVLTLKVSVTYKE